MSVYQRRLAVQNSLGQLNVRLSPRTGERRRTNQLSDRHPTLRVASQTGEQTITTVRRNQGRVPVRWSALVDHVIMSLIKSPWEMARQAKRGGTAPRKDPSHRENGQNCDDP